ncbi:hypothetical protein BDW67DRAFT_157855 [Aspergillus spinulosporus]
MKIRQKAGFRTGSRKSGTLAQYFQLLRTCSAFSQSSIDCQYVLEFFPRIAATPISACPLVSSVKKQLSMIPTSCFSCIRPRS